MAKSKKYQKIVEKSIKASLVALEIFNKPNFEYKEEVFAIMMANAWELLLKAKIVKNKGTLLSIYVAEKLKTKKGDKLKRFYPKKSRSGNPLTVDIFRAADIAGVDSKVRANIEMLVEVRDNSIHFVNNHVDFSRKMLEIATAAVTNYATYLQENFKDSVKDYSFSFTPISFSNPSQIPVVMVSTPHSNWLKYIDRQEKKFKNDNGNYNFTLLVETKFKKSTSGEAVAVRWSDESDAMAVKVEEENIFITKYNIDYKTLIKNCKDRYKDFKLSSNFYTIKKDLENSKHSEKFSKIRYLKPGGIGSIKQTFYCSEIYKKLDKKYTKK